MFQGRSAKKKTTISSEENDFQELYAKLQFKVDYPTKPNQTLYIYGNIEELGNWDINSVKKLNKLDEKSSTWESDFIIECPVGMNIQYNYLIIDSDKKKYVEKLPNNAMRSITTKRPGQYIICDKKGQIQTAISYKEREKRNTKRKLSRMLFDTLNIQDFMGEPCNLKNDYYKSEDYSDYISNLSPQDLLSYENNKANFDEIDLVKEEEPNRPSLNAVDNINEIIFNDIECMNRDARIIMVSLYLPVRIKKKNMNKKEYEIIEDENSFLSRYINVLKNEGIVNLIWVGMLKNYFDFEEEERPIIENQLKDHNYIMINPNKKEWNLYLFYI